VGFPIPPYWKQGEKFKWTKFKQEHKRKTHSLIYFDAKGRKKNVILTLISTQYSLLRRSAEVFNRMNDSHQISLILNFPVLRTVTHLDLDFEFFAPGSLVNIL